MRIGLSILAIVAVFLASCSGGGPAGPNLADPFIGGTTGINLYLQEGLPPAVIYDNGKLDFGVGVAVENVGESDVGPGTDNPFFEVRLDGINPAQFDNPIIEKELDAPLRGAKKNFDGTIFPGEISTVVFEPLTYLPDLHGNFEITMRADVCYDYMTFSSTEICMKDEILESIQDTSICTLTGEKFPRNSGGPIHVTSLIENPLAESKIQVSFVIEHLGIGEFFKRDTENEVPCDHSITNWDKYWVYVRVLPIDGADVTCTRLGGAEGYVKLYNGAPTPVSCVITRTNDDAPRVYQDLFRVELEYKYGQFIETPIIIQ